jgi:hypothetical protein
LSAAAALAAAKAAGIQVRLNGDRLTLNARDKPSPDLLRKLRDHKAEIVAMLES